MIGMVAAHVYKAIDALPVTAHPMTQFTTGVMALQVSSSTSGMPFLLSIISELWNKITFHCDLFAFQSWMQVVFKLISHCVMDHCFEILKPWKWLSFPCLNPISGWEWVSKSLWQRIAKIKVSLGFILPPMCLMVAFHGVHNYCLYRFWEPTYEDCLNLIARLSPVASYVYRR